METIEKTPLSEKIVMGLKKAVVELEDFRLQAALGKAEARDVYEEAKKKFDKYVNEAKVRVEDAKDTARERSTQLKALLETLQVQLSLGKAESKEIFKVQQKKITKALNDLEAFIKKNKTANEYYTKLLMEAGKFRVKLDILKMRWELNRLETRIEFDDKKKELLRKLSDVKNRLTKNEEADKKWEHFKDDISDAYSHLKKAFVG
ncbi:MAG: hypothetical protein EPN85_09615 [Bacteroidetes bacterium]|nr:MAG: hypothetical protein EPN85_09615 [Bacteroidota bacterium]